MNSSIFKLVLCVFSIAIFACGGDSSVRDSARESIGGSDPTLSAPSTNPSMTASTPGGSVMHYTCPKNCVGSGGAAAGTCPVCGSEYVHNQAFHAQSQTPPTTEGGTTTATFQGGTGATATTPGVTPPVPPTPEPAQNAAGVWHYTCAKGCAGGAGTAGTCATCGGPLAHNTAYHQ